MDKDTKRLLISTILLIVGCGIVFVYTYLHKDDNKPVIIKPTLYQECISETVVLDDNGLREFMKSGTGILYFGFESCPWCNISFPILIDVSKEYPEIPIYSYDPYEIREEENELYKEILNEFNDYLEFDSNKNKRLYVPDVFAVYNGIPLADHKDAVDSYKVPNRELTESETEELKEIYRSLYTYVEESFEDGPN